MYTRLAPVLFAAFFASSVTASADSLSVSFETTTGGGEYAPRNIVAVWVEDSGGGFVKTIGRWAGTRRQHLVAWLAASGQDADAVSGATRDDHQTPTPLMVTWDLTDRNMQVVPDGTYTIRIEGGEDNSTTPDQNHQGTFTFQKNGVASTQMVSGGGFNNVVIDYAILANPADCDNGMIDTGETCDPPGSCPTSCEASSAMCMENVLSGVAAECTALCAEQPITACIGGDGCCPDGCGVEDSDCGPGQGGDIQGGCRSVPGGSGSASLFLLLLLAVASRRRSIWRRGGSSS